MDSTDVSGAAAEAKCHKFRWPKEFKSNCNQFLFLHFSVFVQVENVRMIDRYNTKNPTVGTLYLTATHLIFVEPDSNKETWVSGPLAPLMTSSITSTKNAAIVARTLFRAQLEWQMFICLAPKTRKKNKTIQTV